jgi:hypothetical protein
MIHFYKVQYSCLSCYYAWCIIPINDIMETDGYLPFGSCIFWNVPDSCCSLSTNTLCLPMFHISNLMNHFADNSSAEGAVDMILHSILFGNMDLITSIWYLPQDMEHLMIGIEMKRSYESMNALSELLLKNDRHMFKTQLDQDLLCISIMNSFGGETNGNDEM